jgi:hypothetical protein
MFVSPSVWMTPADNSVEWPNSDIWSWAKGLLCRSFIFTYLRHLNSQNNIVSNFISNCKGLIPAVKRHFHLHITLQKTIYNSEKI